MAHSSSIWTKNCVQPSLPYCWEVAIWGKKAEKRSQAENDLCVGVMKARSSTTRWSIQSREKHLVTQCIHQDTRWTTIVYLWGRLIMNVHIQLTNENEVACKARLHSQVSLKTAEKKFLAPTSHLHWHHTDWNCTYLANLSTVGTTDNVPSPPLYKHTKPHFFEIMMSLDDPAQQPEPGVRHRRPHTTTTATTSGKEFVWRLLSFIQQEANNSGQEHTVLLQTCCYSWLIRTESEKKTNKNKKNKLWLARLWVKALRLCDEKEV